MIHDQLPAMGLECGEIHIQRSRVTGVQGVDESDGLLAVESRPVPVRAVIDESVKVLEAEMVGSCNDFTVTRCRGGKGEVRE